MSNGGWIKLHRQIVENVLWIDSEPFDRRSAWIDLLLMVNHENRQIMVNGKIMTVERGQTLTSELKLASRWRWSRNKVRRFLEAIEAANMVTVNRTGYGTWLNVVNYAFFQGRATSNDTRVDTTDDTAHDTAGDTTVDTQTRIYKNTKEDKNDKNFLSGASAQKKSAPPTQKDIEAYCREKGYKMDVLEFMEYYRMREWELTGGKKVTKSNFKAAVDYWNRKGKKLAGEGGDNVAYFEEYVPDIRTGTESPFEGSLVDELKRRRS